MKKVKIILLFMSIFLCIGCTKNVVLEDTSDKNKQNVVSIIEENVIEEKDPGVIDDRYKTVDKNKLEYKIRESKSGFYYYETENSFVGSALLGQIPNIDDKKYYSILLSYTFACELVPISISYDKAIEYAKSVLPDDIKEEKVKFDNKTGIIWVVYSSNKGNFVVGLNAGILSIQDGQYTYDKKSIVGISYFKEFL